MELLAYTRPCTNIKFPEPVDFYDFPETIISFAESLPGSQLATVDDVAYFRVKNAQLRLITYFCDSYRLQGIINDLVVSRYSVNSLQFANKDMEAFNSSRKVYGKSWFASRDVWDMDKILYKPGKHGKHLRRAFRQADHFAIHLDHLIHPKTVDEVLNVERLWIDEAKTRHYMVVKGDSMRFVLRHYALLKSECKSRIMYVRKDKELIGFVGYEVVDNKASISIFKTLAVPGFSDLAKFVWMNALDTIFHNNSVDYIFCGANCDEIKEYVGLNHKRCYTLFSKIRGVV